MLRKIFILSFMLFGMWVFGQKNEYKMLIGTYTEGNKSEGIYNLSFDAKGKLLSKSLAAATDNPSFLAFSPDGRFLYAVNESGEKSAVSAFGWDKEKGTLTPLNKIGLGNAGPCFLSVTERHVITANYGNGSISVLERNPDGSLTDTVQTIFHQRKAFGRGRFGPSHVHQALFAPDGKWLVATNLGKDCIYTYRYNPMSKKEPLTLIEEKILTKHGGPRHAAFSQNGKRLYLLNEKNAEITVFEVTEQGKLNILQETTIADKAVTEGAASDIHLSPDEKYLYAANRGTANTITCFKVAKNGTLAKKHTVSTAGNAPRNFSISSDGKFVFVGNQKSDNIAVFSRNKCTGKLTLLKQNAELEAPVCLLAY